MEYNPQDLEAKWQAYWREHHTYRVDNQTDKPKFYVLDMFPYPSGAGLHVGHPLGYIATDIVARYKRMQGYNVLHPMGFDSFGLPAEQYAIDTGQHPALTTAQNIATFKQQLAKIGFDYDWEREIQTSSPTYYRWTQWIFRQFFEAWYNLDAQRAEPIASLIQHFAANGNGGLQAACDDDTPQFTAQEWGAFSPRQQYEILLKYRLTYLADTFVNWCPALGTVLANDEIKDGVSERGGYPVERKKMRQWMMRITAYAERLLEGLERVDWSDALKEMQRNWIGKSLGCEIDFTVSTTTSQLTFTAFTTRIDTIFGVTYLALAPEHEAILHITTEAQRDAVEEYIARAKNRSERERQAEVKTVTGVFTGAYATNPFTHEQVPIWVADYVLAGYGTGVVMGVPSSDDRDFRFATHFGLPIVRVIAGTEDLENPTELKRGKMINSGFLNGLETDAAIQRAIQFAEEHKLGKAKVNYRLRDAVFSRQRYWGEPVPVYFHEGLPYLIAEDEMPLVLPEIDEYRPTAEGEPPLARATAWRYRKEFEYESTTMPGWAGSSWYFLRYTDPHNDRAFAAREATDYWGQVDLYVGGTEHAVGHLLYARFWTKLLYDLGYIGFDEPFKKLVNQGMIQGQSALMYRVKGENKYISAGLKDQYDTTELHVDVNIVENNVLDIAKFRAWRAENANAEFVLEEGKYLCGTQVEKMSKRWYNVVNPDDVIARYSADTLRLYEMFLGPLEQSKPWNTQGIDGTHRFLKKLWRLFYEGERNIVSRDTPSPEMRKILHRTIKGVREDLDRLSFNTVVSKAMVAVNELTELKCHHHEILDGLLRVLAPFAPHITEELWTNALGNSPSIHHAEYPVVNEAYLVEDSFEYPIQINGKLRANLRFALTMSSAEIEQAVLADEIVQKWLEGKAPKKIVVVPKRIVNVVV